MGNVPVDLIRLRRLIGARVVHQGAECVVIEVLEDGPSLVLQDRVSRSIQDDQFGEPSREVPETYTVPVLAADRRAFHPDFAALGLSR